MLIFIKTCRRFKGKVTLLNSFKEGSLILVLMYSKNTIKGKYRPHSLMNIEKNLKILANRMKQSMKRIMIKLCLSKR